MYFVAHDIMSRTACEENILDQGFEWEGDDEMDEIDVLMGCSRELMSLIRRISELAEGLDKVRLSRLLLSALELSTCE